MSKKLVVSVAVVLAIMAAAFFLYRNKPQPITIAPKVISQLKVAIGYSRLRISLPIFVAKERKIFSKHGIDVSLIMYDTAQPLMQSLLENKIQAAGYTALPITYSGMLRSGTDLLFTTAMLEDQGHRISYLLRAKGTAITEIKALKGKRIGILPTVAYKAWLGVILKENGVEPSSVIMQQIEPSLQPQALKSGGVDALFTNDPAATAAILKAGGELITSFVEVPRYLGEPFLFGSFNIRKDWAATHPEETRRIVESLDEAIDIINTEGKSANSMLAPFLPPAFQDQIPHYPPARYQTSNQSTPDEFQAASDEYYKLTIIPSPLQVRSSVYVTSVKHP